MRFLPLPVVLRNEPLAAQLGVSKVARSQRGFLSAYKRAGGRSKLSADWKRKREAFIARHMAQAKSQGEPWFDDQGKPTRRHLALIMWAYSPKPSKLESRMANPRPVPIRAGRLEGIASDIKSWRKPNPTLPSVDQTIRSKTCLSSAVALLDRRSRCNNPTEDISHLLLPKDAIPQYVGSETGKTVQSGTSKYTGQFGAVRYVLYQNGVAVAAMQVVRNKVANVYTLPSERRKGWVTKLWNRAKRDYPKLEHLTNAG
jgi:hypothetical protein